MPTHADSDHLADSLTASELLAVVWHGINEVAEPQSIPRWLDTPNPTFEGLKPREVIEGGEVDRLWKMVFELEGDLVG